MLDKFVLFCFALKESYGIFLTLSFWGPTSSPGKWSWKRMLSSGETMATNLGVPRMPHRDNAELPFPSLSSLSLVVPALCSASSSLYPIAKWKLFLPRWLALAMLLNPRWLQFSSFILFVPPRKFQQWKLFLWSCNATSLCYPLLGTLAQFPLLPMAQWVLKKWVTDRLFYSSTLISPHGFNSTTSSK